MTAKVTGLERFTLVVPFVDRVRREMERAGIHTWSELEITRVDTDAGISGWGETVQNYTWGRVQAEEKAIGRSPFETMWDDSLGAGLQMALFDAAGKLAGVPLYRLLGGKCRDWAAISFWDHDMSPEKYAVEAQTAVGLGYNCIKIKTRPWWDVRETIRRISEATPDHFRIDADWNAMLNNAANAVPLLRELERAFPKIKIWEDPLPRNDAAGNRYMRTQIERPVAHHYGSIGAREGLEMGGVCDGWILGGGVSRIMRDGAAAAAVNMPFFLQMVGAAPTTALSLHLSAVLEQAQWPTITCHELYEHSLLRERLPVVDGHARVPEEPGLGISARRGGPGEVPGGEGRPQPAEAADLRDPARGRPRLLRELRPEVGFLRQGEPSGRRLGMPHGADRRRRQQGVRRPPRARQPGAGGQRQLKR